MIKRMTALLQKDPQKGTGPTTYILKYLQVATNLLTCKKKNNLLKYLDDKLFAKHEKNLETLIKTIRI